MMLVEAFELMLNEEKKKRWIMRRKKERKKKKRCRVRKVFDLYTKGVANQKRMGPKEKGMDNFTRPGAILPSAATAVAAVGDKVKCNDSVVEDY